MNYRETFEDRFGGVIESCSDEVLEAFDWLIDQLEEADRLRERLRRRVSALENANNVLGVGALTEDDVQDLDEAISTLSSVGDRILALKEELDSAKELCESVMLCAENGLRVKQEYEDTVQSITAQDTPAEEIEHEELPKIIINDEPISSDPEENGSDSEDEFFFSEAVPDTNEADDEMQSMTEKLRVLVMADAEPSVEEPAPTLSEEEDISHILFKYFSDDPVSTEEDAVEETIEDIEETVEDVEETVEETVEEPIEESAEGAKVYDDIIISETPVEEIPEEIVEEVTEEVAEETVEEIVEEAVEEIVEETVEEIVEEAVEEIVEESVEEAIEESTEDASSQAEEQSKPKEQIALDDIISAFNWNPIVSNETETVEEEKVTDEPKPEPAAPKSELQSIRASLADIKNRRKK